MSRVGGRDVALGEDAGGQLIQQRLEQMVVRAVDDRHVDVGAPQRLGGEQAAEPGADDHDAVSPACEDRAVARLHRTEGSRPAG